MIISEFYDIVIKMNKEGYIHIINNDDETLLEINTGDMIEGYIEDRELTLVQAWIILREDELIENNRLISENKLPNKIEPLQ